MVPESFEIIGQIRGIQTIAVGDGIRDLVYLEERFGCGNSLFGHDINLVSASTI